MVQKVYAFFLNHIKKSIALIILLVAGIAYYHCLPETLFKAPTSTVLTDKDGELLGARTADDGQWRFPPDTSEISEKFKKAILAFEDQRFHYHPGVDPVAVARAAWQNIREGKIVSGASTITMQVIRLMRDNKPRTFKEKIIESILATRLELRYTKKEILGLYAAHAPFGGNVVGLEAASWRYFHRKPTHLSWAQAATLAVLPNEPGLIYPGKNKKELKEKRNFLLNRLNKKGIIDSITCVVAKKEPLPGAPHPLPHKASHLLTRCIKEGRKGEKIKSTLSEPLQQTVENIVQRHHKRLRGNRIFNAAALIMDTRTGKTKAYVGNTTSPDNSHGNKVDIITSRRSTGSILKPFLYSAMLGDGALLPNMLVTDIPTRFGSFMPTNFSEEYHGMVPASEALSRSLNVPAVRLLKNYGLNRFYHVLEQAGMQTLFRPASDYGLTLILGGAEGRLWDITGMYAGLGRKLMNEFNRNIKKNRGNFFPPQYVKGSFTGDSTTVNAFTTGAIWHTLEAMIQVTRPGNQRFWKRFGSGARIAWKTGTSFGHRDAWAVGITPRYTVGVWTGNADGEGRPNLTGAKAAAPLLFDIFDHLQFEGWFEKPWPALTKMKVCNKSGHKASENCPETHPSWVQESGKQSPPCPYHKKIHLDSAKKHRVHSGCMNVSEMVTGYWFVLPPVREWYYKQHNPSYRELPPYLPGCRKKQEAINALGLVYPHPGSRVIIPKELSGKQGKTVFEATHRQPGTKIYWHLDNTYLGSTSHFHEMPVRADTGKHTLTIVDKHGNRLERKFEVVHP